METAAQAMQTGHDSLQLISQNQSFLSLNK